MGCCCSAVDEPIDLEAMLARDKKQYAVTVPQQNDAPGWGVPKRATSAKDGLDKFATFPDCVVKTVWEAFQRGKKVSGGKNFLGTRNYTVEGGKYAMHEKNNIPLRGDYVHESFNSVGDNAEAFGRGIVKLGALAKDNVGLFSINRAEWVTAAIGLHSQNMRWVSLYATLGPDAIDYIVNHAQTKIVIVSRENVGTLIKVLPKIAGTVKTIIQFDANAKYGNTLDNVEEANIAKCKESGVSLVAYSEVIAMGSKKAGDEEKEIPLNLPGEDDLAMVMYTSGTTGNPKGAMIKHGQLMSAIGALMRNFILDNDTVHYSYLPLAHIFECAAQIYIWSVGGSINFFQGDIRMLIEDLKAVEPTIFCGVPRVYTRMYQQVMSGIKEKAQCVQNIVMNKYYGRRQMVYDGLAPLPEDGIFDTIKKERLGLGRCKVLISGAAPCPPYVMDFLRVVVNCTVLQGYGMTETCAGITVTHTNDVNLGHVGPPISSVEVVLRDIPDMNYFSAGFKGDSRPCGEVMCRGPNIFEGYYQDQAQTDGTFEKCPWGGEKWLATGDVGRWNANGTLSIIDRKKNMCKLSQGEYVSLEKVEDIYGKAPVCGQVFVYGNAYKSFLVAVLAPNCAELQKVAIENGWWPDDTKIDGVEKIGRSQKYQAAVNKLMAGPHAKDVKKFIFDQMKAQEGPAKLQSFEKVRDIFVSVDFDDLGMVFTEANDCLTPSMKKKRKQLNERYMDKLMEMYTANGEAPEKDEKW